MKEKYDVAHFIQTGGRKTIYELEGSSWNVYTLKLKTSLPKVDIFYVGITTKTVEERVNTHLNGGEHGNKYIRNRGVEKIIKDPNFTFNYSEKGKILKYKDMEEIENETAKKLCSFLTSVQNFYPEKLRYFLVIGPKPNFTEYLSDEEILEILQKKNVI